MLELKVYDDSGNEYFLDIYKNDPINLKYQYTDVEKIQTAVGSFTQSFRVPATQPNVDFFGTFFNANTQGGFNAKRKNKAELSVNTVPIISGFIQLKQVFLSAENYADFQLVFFGDNVDFARSIGDSELKDLDLSAYNHALTYANFTAGQAGTLNSGNVRHCLFDKARNWTNIWPTTTLISLETPVELSDLVPILRTRAIVEAIFSEAGFTLDSNFFSAAAFDDVYTPMFNGSPFPLASEPYSETKFNVGLSATESLVFTESGQVITPNNLVDSGGNFYDPLSLYNTTTNKFTPTISGSYNISLSAFVTNTTGSGITVQLCLYNETDGEIVGYIFDFSTMVIGSSSQLEGSSIRNLSSSKSYNIGVLFLQNGGGTVDLKTLAGGTTFRLDGLAYPDGGQTVDMANNAPNIKQIDYILGLQKMFNLVFIHDKLDPKKITVEPFNDYNTGGTVKDWSDYVDYSKDVVLKPTTDIQFKDYEFTYSEGEDFVAKIYQDGGGRVYGRYLIEDGENDFSTSELKITSQFQPLTIAPIGNMRPGVNIHKPINDKGEIITKPKAMVGYFSKLDTYDATTNPNNLGGLFINDNGTSQTVQQFPYLGHYSAALPDVEDKDLNFGPEIPTHPIEASPADNLFKVYWQKFVEQLYSTEARIMECHLYLTSAQIADFEFNDQIWVKDSYWRVLSLNYSPNSDTTVKAKLIKILGDTRACEWLPYQSNASGLITFIDSSGATGNPTQACCEQFGYDFNNSQCWQPTPEDPGNPIGLDYEPIIDVSTGFTQTESDIDAVLGQTIVISTVIRSVTVTLPDVTKGINETITIKRTTGANTLLIRTNGSQTIDGAASSSIATNYDSLTLLSNGAEWLTI
tara:strand:- start:1226 stop:3808 length:2583 start_codon:yes stop_codon:yes gene_type:complete